MRIVKVSTPISVNCQTLKTNNSQGFIAFKKSIATDISTSSTSALKHFSEYWDDVLKKPRARVIEDMEAGEWIEEIRQTPASKDIEKKLKNATNGNYPETIKGFAKYFLELLTSVE